MEKVDNMEEQIDGQYKQRDGNSKDQNEILEIKNCKRREWLDRFISRLDTDEERISELDDTPRETSKIEKQKKKKRLEKKKNPQQNRIPKKCKTTIMCITYAYWE